MSAVEPRAASQGVLATLCLLIAGPGSAAGLPSATPADSAGDPSLQVEEVVVTARRRSERLQDVPDAVTAFTATSIEAAGIRSVTDFAALTPNLVFQPGDAFRAGFFNLSMRGIGNSQGGWPSVTYVVDGIAADSTDSINSGSLEDIERIEVLRGPQSALYGAGAIAGAINVVTQDPTNELHTKLRASYGNGNDRQVSATVSGPIRTDTVLFRITGTYRDSDGLIQSSSNGLDLAFRNQKQVQGQLLIHFREDSRLDLRASYDKEENGTTYQDKLPDVTYIDDFDSRLDSRRGFAGRDGRELWRGSARLVQGLGWADLTAIAGVSHIDQNIDTGFCYDDPNDPVLPAQGGGAQCPFGVAFGSAASPDQAQDNFFASLDNFRSVTSDVRLSSTGDGPLTWTAGASGMYRKTLEGFDIGLITPPAGVQVPLYSQWNATRDTWWGVYGQASLRMATRFELTLAARYDDNKYENTSYTDRTQSEVVPVPNANGTPVRTQVERADAFQPKAQLSYRFTDEIMSYATVSRGFRAGYFNTGNFTLPEHTTNYELGLKSELLGRRLVSNLAVFHTDYSNQQFSTIIDAPPFRVSSTIPETRIDGAEYEATVLLSRFLSISGGLAYLDAEVSNHTRSPSAPRFNGSFAIDFNHPLVNEWKARVHLDDRYNGAMYLSTNDTQRIPSKNYLNARLSVGTERYELAAFSHNLTDTRQATIASSDIAGGYIRYQNMPRSYGLEFRVSY